MAYRIWRSDEAVRIEANGASIELTAEEAVELGRALVPARGSAVQTFRISWTPELDAEVVRLTALGHSSSKIGAALQCSGVAIEQRRRILGIYSPRPQSLVMRKRLAARKAAE